MNFIKRCTQGLRVCVKWFYFLFALGIILLAIVVQAGRSFSPLLNEHKQDLCDYFSQKLNAKVSIGSITAEWDGLKPMVEVQDLHIENQTHQSILELDHAQMRLDLLGSLLHARLVWTQLSLSKTEMNFVQSRDGFWRIVGVEAKNDQQDTDSAQLDLLLDMALLSRRIEFEQTKLNFQFASGKKSTLNSPILRVENSGDFHRLVLQVDIDNRPKSLSLVVEGRGDPRQREKFTSRGFIKLNQFPTDEPVAATTAFLLHGIDAEVRSEGTLDASLWFSSRPHREGFDLVGKIGVQRVSVPIMEKKLSLDKFSADVSGYWLYGSRWQVALQNINAKINQNVVKKLNFAASSEGFDDPVILHLQEIDLQRLHHALDESEVFGNGHLRDIIAQLAPEGVLQNTQIIIPPHDLQQIQLRANLQKVAVNAWHGVPALRHVDGYLQADKRGGFVDIDSQHGFSMHYDPTYTAPMEYEQVQGQVAWKLDPENNQIFVNSGKLLFVNQQEKIQGYMWLSMPWKKDTADTDLFLQIGGKQLVAGDYKKYTPATVPNSLMHWLDKAIGEKNNGQISDVGFLYRGTLSGHNHQARSFQLGMNLQDTQLNYSSEWPALTHINADLWIGDEQVKAKVYSGKIFNSELGETLVDVAPNPDDHGSLLKVQGSVTGAASDGLRALRETQLRKYVGNNFDAWTINGDLHSRIFLAIPLESDAQGSEQSIELDLNAEKFSLNNLNLNLSNLHGHLSYSQDQGLSSEDLSANFLGYPVALQLSNHQVPIEKKMDHKIVMHHETWIEGKGEVNSNLLANWSRRPEILFFTGVIPYELQVRLHPTEEYSSTDTQKPFADISITSSLEGVEVNLPQPYNKLAEKNKSLRVTLALDDNVTDLKVTYADQVNAWLQLETHNQYQLHNATIALNESAELNAAPQFLIKGTLDKLDIDAWKKVYNDYQQYQQQINSLNTKTSSNNSAEQDSFSSVAGLKINADILLNSYELGPVNLKSLRIHAEPTVDSWKLNLQHPDVVGDLIIPLQESRPLQINLQKLRLPSEWLMPSAKTTVENSPVAVPEKSDQSNAKNLLDPEKIPAMNLSVDDLMLVNAETQEAKSVGKGSLELRPSNSGILFDEIRGEFMGITIAGSDASQGARLNWVMAGEQSRSEFSGVLSAKDVSQVLREWQKPDMINSTHAQFNVDVSWAGDPKDFSLTHLEGKCSFQVEKGRFKQSPGAGSDGFLRLMAILNFDSLARRLRFDFSDLYQSGLAYDQITGVAEFKRGVMVFENPLVVKSPSSKLQLVGRLDLEHEQIDARLIATLPVVGNYTFFTALVGGLPAAAGIYVVSKLFKKQVDQATSLSYAIHGGWDNPEIRFDRLFESEKSLRNSVNQPEPKPEKIKNNSDSRKEEEPH